MAKTLVKKDSVYQELKNEMGLACESRDQDEIAYVLGMAQMALQLNALKQKEYRDLVNQATRRETMEAVSKITMVPKEEKLEPKYTIPPLITVKQTAELMHESQGTVYRKIKDGTYKTMPDPEQRHRIMLPSDQFFSDKKKYEERAVSAVRNIVRFVI